MQPSEVIRFTVAIGMSSLCLRDRQYIFDSLVKSLKNTLHSTLLSTYLSLDEKTGNGVTSHELTLTKYGKLSSHGGYPAVTGFNKTVQHKNVCIWEGFTVLIKAGVQKLPDHTNGPVK